MNAPSIPVGNTTVMIVPFCGGAEEDMDRILDIQLARLQTDRLWETARIMVSSHSWTMAACCILFKTAAS
jgi:hypothetical protein